MGENTKIEWAHHTFNPWLGCTKVGPGCDNCYAESWAKRSGLVKWGFKQERRRTTAANWRKPLAWNAEAERLGVRYRVFCSSLADVFDNAAPRQWRQDLFDLILKTPCLDWLLLTKRIGNAARMLQDISEQRGSLMNANDNRYSPLPNVWIGATICNQEEADRDIQKLLEIPAHVRFLSLEPLLGPVNLHRVRDDSGFTFDALSSKIGISFMGKRIDWIIAGGESGPKARPMHPGWIRYIRDQCASAGVPFLFKQWGEWQIASAENGHHDCDMTRNKAYWLDTDGTMTKPSSTGLSEHAYAMVKVGKKLAGRLLDGVEHNDYPERSK